LELAVRKIHHAIDNIEFGVTDMPATQAFYESAFGWRFNNYGPEYAGIVAPDGDGEVGGLDANRAPGTGGPLVQIYSVDLDATAASVTAAGGQIVEGPYDFPGGRGFQFTDPSGNQLAVWTPA
jgi:predicted enzyme related to lactoylglutathione lyase